MGYASIEAKRRYQAEWIRAKRQARRAAYLNARVCARCGSRNELEIHHRNPAQKDDHRVWTWPEAKMLAELAKCDVLCRPCHQWVHARWRAARRRHGTTTMYRHGCRCRPCQRAASAANARRRATPATRPGIPIPPGHPAGE